VNTDTLQVHSQIIARVRQVWAQLPAEKIRAAANQLHDAISEVAGALYDGKLAKGERAVVADAPPPAASTFPVNTNPAAMVAGIPPAPAAPAPVIVEAPVENPKEPKE